MAIFRVSFENSRIKAHQKIAEDSGGFADALPAESGFAHSVAALGDVDGDGVVDLVVGADTDEGGAVWLLFLQTDGTVRAQQKISATAGASTSPRDLLFSVRTLP